MHDGLVGIVVVNFETGESNPNYGLKGWGQDIGGLLVLTEEAGLVRYPRYSFDQSA